MSRQFKIGLTIHNFDNEQTLLLLKSMLRNNLRPDFVIYHQKFYKRKILRFIHVLLKKDPEEKKLLLQKIKSVDTFNIPDINSPEAGQIFEKYGKSLLLCNTGIIKQRTIKGNPETCFINVHGSKLPQYRGVDNVMWALWHMDDIFITVHRINNGIDEGDILYQELAVRNVKNNRVFQVLQDLQEIMAEITCKAFHKFLSNEISFTPQEQIGDPFTQFYSMHPILKNILINKYK